MDTFTESMYRIQYRAIRVFWNGKSYLTNSVLSDAYRALETCNVIGYRADKSLYARETDMSESAQRPQWRADFKRYSANGIAYEFTRTAVRVRIHEHYRLISNFNESKAFTYVP
jgi:hypothetical protein